jgi:hypothetical protein
MSKTRPIITIYSDRASNTWLARFHDDPEVIALFGSDIIPTAYTLVMPGLEVCRVVERRNPGTRVRLIDLDGTTQED